VFGAGTMYILRLMAKAPEEGEAGEPRIPIRTAGITPAAAVAERRDEPG
jgi:cytochrome bd ubiquinol oxidase subunit I